MVDRVRPVFSVFSKNAKNAKIDVFGVFGREKCAIFAFPQNRTCYFGPIGFFKTEKKWFSCFLGCFFSSKEVVFSSFCRAKVIKKRVIFDLKKGHF